MMVKADKAAALKVQDMSVIPKDRVLCLSQSKAEIDFASMGRKYYNFIHVYTCSRSSHG
jgi:hypothetical protein